MFDKQNQQILTFENLKSIKYLVFLPKWVIGENSCQLIFSQLTNPGTNAAFHLPRKMEVGAGIVTSELTAYQYNKL